MTRMAGNTNDVPTELPNELADKFQIKDQTAGKPAEGKKEPAPVPAPAPKAASKKRGASPVAADEKAVSVDTGPKTPPNRRPAKEPIWLGEQMTLEITYFGMSAGDFTIESLPYKQMNNRKVYHVKGNAKSSRVFSLFYTVDDTVESFFDYEGFYSHRFNLELKESKQTRIAIELNDSEKGSTYYWNRWNHYTKGYTENKVTSDVPRFAQDSVSALYYVRSLPLPTGAVINFPVISEGKWWEAQVTVVRREEMQTPMGKVMTIVLKPEMKYQGVLQKRGDSHIWLTDDDRRVLVQLEAKVRIGTVFARLKKFVPGTPP